MTTRSYKGAQTGGKGPALPIEIAQAAPNKLLITATTPDGPVKRGYDGANAWVSGARPYVIGYETAADTQREADFNWPLKIKERFRQMRFGGPDKIGARPVYVVFGVISEYFRWTEGMPDRACVGGSTDVPDLHVSPRGD